MASQLVGMGCTLKTIGGRIVITEVKAGGGAAVSGNVNPYDVLVSVDGVRLLSTDHAKKLLLGAAGTSFVAGLERCGTPLHVTIWRGGVQKAGAHRSHGPSLQDHALPAAQPSKPAPQRAQDASLPARAPAVARPPPSADQIRSFGAAALFEECCCPQRAALSPVQKLELYNLLALRAQDLAARRSSELPHTPQELRAISASCAKIQVTLDGIDVSGEEREFRKSIIKLCEAVASQCDAGVA
jgi:hypothetical protein